MSTGSSELSEQAEVLQGAISFFKVNGAREPNRQPAAAASKRPQARKPVARPPQSSKPKSNGAEIDMESDTLGSDHLDRDFKVYQ
jgi:hypothetical protein